VTAKIAGFWLFWANFDLQAFFMAWELIAAKIGRQ
jgi:hypothetical protein